MVVSVVEVVAVVEVDRSIPWRRYATAHSSFTPNPLDINPEVASQIVGRLPFIHSCFFRAVSFSSGLTIFICSAPLSCFLFSILTILVGKDSTLIIPPLTAQKTISYVSFPNTLTIHHAVTHAQPYLSIIRLDTPALNRATHPQILVQGVTGPKRGAARRRIRFFYSGFSMRRLTCFFLLRNN